MAERNFEGRGDCPQGLHVGVALASFQDRERGLAHTGSLRELVEAQPFSLPEELHISGNRGRDRAGVTRSRVHHREQISILTNAHKCFMKRTNGRQREHAIGPRQRRNHREQDGVETSSRSIVRRSESPEHDSASDRASAQTVYWPPMQELRTNRDLYRFVASLAERHRQNPLTLETYLTNLRYLARTRAHQPALALGELADLLEGAFADGAVPACDVPQGADGGFAEWEERLDGQLRDLRGMAEDGTLEDDFRYYGVDAPSGARWYNLDPCGYLECATAGTFGGWREGDETGRYVPGKVAVLDESGALTTADPRALEEPTVELETIPWPELVDFLKAGQSYE